MTTPLETLYDAARAFVAATPALAAFAQLPADPASGTLAPNPVPALAHLPMHFPTDAATAEGSALAAAVVEAADQIAWNLTYDEDLVGADFLARYGWFELLGPSGHFVDETLVAFIGYWGPGLRYPWHKHASREIYAVVDGRALFERESAAAREMGPGGVSPHAAWEAHALRTADAPVLALALQAGEDLNGVPIILGDRFVAGEPS
ncbi:MAG: dimethylsulfonioproprionate lyase family protein [Neomegalonema sp.]